jgi:hypothetical protein
VRASDLDRVFDEALWTQNLAAEDRRLVPATGRIASRAEPRSRFT